MKPLLVTAAVRLRALGPDGGRGWTAASGACGAGAVRRRIRRSSRSTASSCHNDRVKAGRCRSTRSDVGCRGRSRRRVGESGPQAADRHDASRRRAEAARPRRAPRSAARSRRRSIAPRPAARIPGRPRSIASTAPSTPTRSATCWRSTWTSRRCCRPTIPPPASTTSPTCSACRRRSSKATRRPRPPSAGGPSAARRSGSIARPTACPATCRRTRTWTACRWARAAASSSATPSRSTPSTTCRWGRRAAHGSAARAAAGPRADDLYVTIDGVRVALQGRGATRLRVPAGPHTIAAASVVRSHASGADGVYHVEARTPGITQVTIAGPFNATGPGDTPSRRRLLVCTPASAAEELPCARIDSVRAGHARVPAADRRRQPRARHGAASSIATAGSGRSRPASSARWRASSSIRSSSSGSSASRPGSRPARPSASPISSWRRGCRSSSGAASRTTSCCRSPPRAG